MFHNAKLFELIGIELWNVSNVMIIAGVIDIDIDIDE